MRYKTVGLLYTRTCPLQCGHCIIESSPRATGKMQPAVAESYIRTIVQYADEVCFTGGEPLLYYNEVVELIRMARQLGLRVSLVSGAGWVRTDKAHIARERVRGLAEAGLNKICISWDQYHEEFSPRANAQLLGSLAAEYGIDVVVRGVVPADLEGEKPTVMFDRFPAQFQNLIQLGAAKSLPESQFLHYAEPPRGACDVVLTPAIEPDGNVYACCGPSRFATSTSPLRLGNTNEESLDAIFARGVNDPILNALLTIGPRGLLDLLKKTSAYPEFEPRMHYNNVCDLCMDLTDVPAIVDAVRGKLSDAEGKAMLMAAAMIQAKRRGLLPEAPPRTATREVNHAAN